MRLLDGVWPASPSWLRSVTAVWLVVSLALGACSRAHYRRQADDETYAAISEKARGPAWDLRPFNIVRGPQSRLYDPTNPDRPAMPPDDPSSHELMHYVDGKRGYPHWHRNGDVGFVDAECWRRYLPYDEQGQVVLDLQAAVQVALTNSRVYQTELEDLYLSALDVTFERFRFDTQFFSTNATLFTADGRARPGSGGRSSSELRTETTLDARRLNAIGGELVVGLANSIVWQFSGDNTETNTTLLDFGLVQPLLRFSGRARVLERLTQSERTLLANVRQMQQFQQGFFTEIAVGRDAGDGPVRGAGLQGVGGAGLGIGGTFGATVGGYLGLLQTQQQIRNLASNVAGLRDSLVQLQELYEAGRIRNPLQVEQARQALYNGQSRLLTTKVNYETRLDAFKVQLGLPPELQVVASDPYLDRFRLIDDPLTELQEQVITLLNEVRDPASRDDADVLERLVSRAAALKELVSAQQVIVRQDFAAQLESLAARREQLEGLLRRPEVVSGEVDVEPYLPSGLDARVERRRDNLEQLEHGLDEIWLQLEKLRAAALQAAPAETRKQLVEALTELSGRLLELSLAQAGARLDSVVLPPVELTPPEAFEIARRNRRDWMNARAALVDAWRQIEFDANALLSGLNVLFSGDIRSTDDNPVRFRDTTGRLRVGVEFDAPLTRLLERNVYRDSQIQYQRARRNYMLFEDRISQSLRNVLRVIELNKLNFELRRAAVIVAIRQVDLARERLREPPRGIEGATISPTTARDLVSALSDLLDAQNDFLSIWVNYEASRMSLDLELGTMQLDERGVWIDPGRIDAGRETTAHQAGPNHDAAEFEQLPGEYIPPPAGRDFELPAPDVSEQPERGGGFISEIVVPIDVAKNPGILSVNGVQKQK